MSQLREIEEDGFITIVPAPLDDNITWVQQPAFDKAFSDLTGEPLDHEEWRREINWNFTADDESFT